MPNEVLGGFEHQVLLAMLRLGSEAYSVPIVLELEERTGRRVAPSKVYVTLRRLERRGLLRSRFDPPPTEEGGRERRIFSLEPYAEAESEFRVEYLRRLAASAGGDREAIARRAGLGLDALASLSEELKTGFKESEE